MYKLSFGCWLLVLLLLSGSSGLSDAEEASLLSAVFLLLLRFIRTYVNRDASTMVRHPVEITSVNGTNPVEVDDDIIASMWGKNVGVLLVVGCKTFLLHPNGDDFLRLSSGGLFTSPSLLSCWRVYNVYTTQRTPSPLQPKLALCQMMPLVASARQSTSHFSRLPR